MIVGLVASGLVLLLSLATSGVSGFLVIGGLIAFGTATYAVVTGRASWARIPSRRMGAIAMGVSFAVLLAGASLAPDRAEPQAFVDAGGPAVTQSASPEPTPSTTRPSPTATTATPTPRATATPVPTPTVTTAPEPPPQPVPIAAPIQEAPPPAPAQPSCDPNYSGACVPIDSDVDCAGGSGNGPSYVAGPVYVVGVDIYDLDRDGDGIACDR